METKGMIRPTRSSEALVFDVMGAEDWQRIKSFPLPIDQLDWLFATLGDMYRSGHDDGYQAGVGDLRELGIE